MKRMCYLAYKIISKIAGLAGGLLLPTSAFYNMIEDLLYRIQSDVDVATGLAIIVSLPAEYGLVLDLHYGWGLSRREIATLLGWSPANVSQRLTRAFSLLKYELRPDAFQKAQALLDRGGTNY
jgi:sigma-70-like protein